MRFRYLKLSLAFLGSLVAVGCNMNSIRDRKPRTVCFDSVQPPGPGAGLMELAEPCLDPLCGSAWVETVSPLDLDELNMGHNCLDLSLQECITIALSNARVLRDLGGTLIRSPGSVGSTFEPALIYSDPRFGQEAALADFDANLVGGLLFEKNDRGVNNLFVGDQGVFQQDYHVYQWGVNKRSATGGLYSFRHITNYDNNNQLSNRLGPSAFDSFLESEVRQPLFQGAGTEFNRIAGPNSQPGLLNGVVLARVREDITLADFERGVRDLVADIENAYWDLYFAYRDLEAKIELRDKAQQTWQAQVTKTRSAADIEQAREQYYRFQTEVIDAFSGRPLDATRTNNGTTGGTFRGVGGLRYAERRLRLILGEEINAGSIIRPTDEPSTAPMLFDWGSSSQEAIARREELRRQRWVIKQRQLELLANRNFLLPNVDLVGRYRWRGFGDRLIDFDNDINAASSLLRGEYQEWQAGVEMALPVGFRRAQAAVQNSQLALAREQAVLQEQERLVVFGLSNAFSELRRAYDNRELQLQRLEATIKQLESMQAKGDGEGTDVSLLVELEAQRRLLEIKQRYYQAAIEYQLAVRNLHLEKGTLLDYCQVSLSEGEWNQKAYQDAAERRRLRGVPRQPGAVDPIVSAGPAS
jgi:hypothetical protein